MCICLHVHMCIQVSVSVCLCLVFFEGRWQASAAAAELPGKSEQRRDGCEGLQINKFADKGRGEGIRKEKEEAMRRKGKTKGRVSGSKMLTPGCLLAADRRRMWPGFWVAIKSL